MALEAQEDPFGFSVLIGGDAIKALGGVSILKLGEEHFFRNQASACAIATLSVEELVLFTQNSISDEMSELHHGNR